MSTPRIIKRAGWLLLPWFVAAAWLGIMALLTMGLPWLWQHLY